MTQDAAIPIQDRIDLFNFQIEQIKAAIRLCVEMPPAVAALRAEIARLQGKVERLSRHDLSLKDEMVTVLNNLFTKDKCRFRAVDIYALDSSAVIMRDDGEVDHLSYHTNNPYISRASIQTVRYRCGEIPESETEFYIFRYKRYGRTHEDIYETLDECLEKSWAGEECGDLSSISISRGGQILFGSDIYGYADYPSLYGAAEAWHERQQERES